MSYILELWPWSAKAISIFFLKVRYRSDTGESSWDVFKAGGDNGWDVRALFNLLFLPRIWNSEESS